MALSILIVGGYGQVGRIVAGWLVQRYPGQVIVAGRRLEPARALADELGDHHGTDAIRWMQHYLDRAFTVATPHGPRGVESLTDPNRVRFPDEHRPHPTYRFDFADQHALPESIGARGASTYLCFDSRLATRLLRLLKTLGLHRLPTRPGPATVARLARPWPGGTDRYAIVVRLSANDSQPTHRTAATGRGQSHATGIVTAPAAARLHDGHIPPGIHHLEQVVTLDHLRDRLA